MRAATGPVGDSSPEFPAGGTGFRAASRTDLEGGARGAACRLLLLAALGFVIAPGLGARADTPRRIEAGPGVMSEEEKAIQPDPAKGAEHAVILIEETERDESDDAYPKTAYHLRAKILSNEGRALANITIPYNASEGYLLRWWAKTLLPDGTLLELSRDDLKEQMVAKGGGLEIRVRRAALRGVVPGCVIDYGYAFRDDGIPALQRIQLQRPWPIREFRYRWLPSRYHPGAYHVSKSEGLAVKVMKERGTLTVTGEGLPPVVEEPWMPPDDVVRGAAVFYYTYEGVDPATFWDERAKGIEKSVVSFSEGKECEKAIGEAVAAMSLPPDADLGTKLKSAYAWIASNIRNSSSRTREEVETDPDDDEPGKVKYLHGAARVLAMKAGGYRALDHLFIALARALGAEAHLVMATDRTDHYWDKGLFTMGQFDETLVAVRAPGEPDERAVLVDPGSGLPYGEIPWWVTPTKGLLATAAGARDIVLPGSDARRNVSETRATITLSEDDGYRTVLWTRAHAGQQGLRELRTFRSLTPDARKARLDELCGSGPEFEVSRAVGPDLSEPGARFRLACEGQAAHPAFGEGQAAFHLGFDGAWIQAVPELSDATRSHSVVFHYPRVDLASIEIVSPPGFTCEEPPAPVRIETPFGRYSLTTTRTEIGCRVMRDFALLSTAVRREMYAPLREFLEGVRRADRTQLLFERADEVDAPAASDGAAPTGD